MFDLISIGDAAIDTYVFLKDQDAEVLEKDGERFLGVKFGSKISVGTPFSTIGGNAANNAIGSARLKLKTAIYVNVGNKDDDEADDRIKARLKKESVDISYVAETWDLPSSHHIILDFKGDRTILTGHQPWKYNLPDMEASKWVYFTSLAPSFADSNILNQIINFIERNSSKLAFQPGTAQIKLGLKKNSRLLSLCEIFISNLEEAKMFLGFEDNEKIPVKKLLKKLHDMGPKKVVITDGKEGSYSCDGEKYWKIDIFPAKFVEATGAGDAFSTGIIAGLIYGKDLAESMRWGAANSASVVEQIGPQAGLLTYGKIQERLKENHKIFAKEF